MKTRINIIGAVLLAAVTILNAAPLPPVVDSKTLLRETTAFSRAAAFMADAAPGTLKGPNERVWAHRASLSQGSMGACVGFAFTNWLNSAPAKRFDLGTAYAITLYRWTRDHDQWMDNDGDDSQGTSPYVAMMRLRAEGKVTKVDQWGINYENELRPVVLNDGPVCIAIDWYSGFDVPTDGAAGRGLIKLSGTVRGGHFIEVFGLNQKRKVYYLLQSWGGYAPFDKYNQEVEISFADMRRLLNRGGFGLRPIKRK